MERLFFKSFIALLFITLFLSCEKEDENPAKSIQVSSSITNVTEYGGNDGAIDLTVTGGSPPFSFLWSTNSTTEDIENISAGKYYVVITDKIAQIKTDTFIVTQPEPLPLNISFETQNPSETEAADGSIQIMLEGGIPPFSFIWSNDKTTQDLENLTAGNYIVTITDQTGQTITDTISLSDVLIDIDGNKYATIKIGEQLWMKENLKVTHYMNNTLIQSSFYQNDSMNLEIHGRLYSWDVAMNGSTEEKAQGICPTGWHIPSDEEIKILEISLGMTRQVADLNNTWRGATIGTQLKENGTSGFDLKLSGRCTGSGSFSLIDRVGYFWSSTESGANYAWRRCLDKNANNVGRYNTFQKSYRFSIRCIKNEY